MPSLATGMWVWSQKGMTRMRQDLEKLALLPVWINCGFLTFLGTCQFFWEARPSLWENAYTSRWQRLLCVQSQLHLPPKRTVENHISQTPLQLSILWPKKTPLLQDHQTLDPCLWAPGKESTEHPKALGGGGAPQWKVQGPLLTQVHPHWTL